MPTKTLRARRPRTVTPDTRVTLTPEAIAAEVAAAKTPAEAIRLALALPRSGGLCMPVIQMTR